MMALLEDTLVNVSHAFRRISIGVHSTQDCLDLSVRSHVRYAVCYHSLDFWLWSITALLSAVSVKSLCGPSRYTVLYCTVIRGLVHEIFRR
jgi:hypothetical protein